MFGRGNWAVIGLTPESLETFLPSLTDYRLMLTHSQLAASAITRFLQRDAVGINPYKYPRLDEMAGGHIQRVEDIEALATFASSGPDERKDMILPETLVQDILVGFAREEEAFKVGDGLYGFWFVLNLYKDVSHKASIKERHSYKEFERPSAFLAPPDKKIVDALVKATSVPNRKQFPVLLDLNRGRIYIETVSKNEILAVIETLESLGLKTVAMAWKFDVSGHWPSKFLTKLYENTQHSSDFKKRAEDASRFTPDQIEELEDAELEKILKKYFSDTELETELHALLSGPAQIQLHETSLPITAQVAVTATTLLGVTETAQVYSASVTLQERRSNINRKTGTERLFRVDTLAFDINDQVNVLDAGAAALKGLDIPQFKKAIQKEIKQTKQCPPLDRFWRDWTIALNHAVTEIEQAIVEVLELNPDRPYGIQPLYEGGSDDVIEGDA